VWWHLPIIPLTWEVETGGPQVRATQTKKGSQTLSSKEKKNKKLGGIAQVVKCLLGMCKALGSILGTLPHKK
jgi:hypothetical protein